MWLESYITYMFIYQQVERCCKCQDKQHEQHQNLWMSET